MVGLEGQDLLDIRIRAVKLAVLPHVIFLLLASLRFLPSQRSAV
jgi:hypothetical protein